MSVRLLKNPLTGIILLILFVFVFPIDLDVTGGSVLYEPGSVIPISVLKKPLTGIILVSTFLLMGTGANVGIDVGASISDVFWLPGLIPPNNVINFGISVLGANIELNKATAAIHIRYDAYTSKLIPKKINILDNAGILIIITINV